MNIRHYLAKFEAKKTPDRIILNYEIAINHNAYSVYITHPVTNINYLFIGYNNNSIIALMWNEEEKTFNLPQSLNPDELKPESFSGIYYYKAHQLRFTNLKDIVWWREANFKLSAINNNWKDSREKYRYRKERKEIKNRMDVLASVVTLYLEQDGDNGIHTVHIMNNVFGALWLYHDDKERMKKDLKLSLSAFVTNGDLIKGVGDNYSVNGKALLTLAKYSEEEHKYVESIRIQKRMFWATVFSFFAASASAAAAFMGIR